jgi:phospholipid/cholesterol/gamma-HCH transport system substrate-binding protein
MTTRSSRLRSTGRRRERRPFAAVLAGLAVAAVVGGFIYLAEESYNGLPFISYRTLYASLPNIGHLQVHDAVQIAGVHVGQVLRTRTADGRALVELQLSHVKPLPVDTQVLVRDNGLLGDRDIQLVPGGSRKLLPDGATITGDASDYHPSLPDTLDLLDAKTRGALGQMLRGLGEGVLGRGVQLGDAIHAGPQTGVNLNTVAYSILSKPGAAARLLPATDAGVSALDAARSDIAHMFAPGATTLKAFVDERARFEQAISEAPSALIAIDRGFGAPGQRLLSSLRTLSSAADRVLPAAPAALSAATRLLEQTRGPLQKTRIVLGEVPPAVPATLEILASLQPDLAPLRAAFTWLVGPVTNLGQHGCDVKSWAENLRSATLHGVEPGGGFGPLDGIRVIAAPEGVGALSTVEPTALGAIGSFPNVPYYQPCKFVPGDTFSAGSLGTLLGVR